MDDQKIENELNLALDSTKSELIKSASLNTGYSEIQNKWTLIVKYNGNISSYGNDRIKITALRNNYAVIEIDEELIDTFADLPEIEYIEKPKALYFADFFANAASCITQTYEAFPGLDGSGVLIAVIDSGIDYMHMDFRNADGSTRIVSYWDQTVEGTPPKGYFTGALFDENDLNRLLKDDNQDLLSPSPDTEGHGTAVAGIAAGNGRASSGRFRGAAYNSSILAVKLGLPNSTSFPRTSELMQAINYCVDFAYNKALPLVINLSFGNNYGGHDGTTLLEQFIDSVANIGRSVIVIGTGNEGSSGTHTTISFEDNKTAPQRSEFSIGEYEPSLSIQIWKSFLDDIQIEFSTPSGETTGILSPAGYAVRFNFSNFTLLAYYGTPSPYSTSQEIYFELVPNGDYLETGIYTITFTPLKITNGRIDLWLPSAAVLNNNTAFLKPSPYTTLTIPSTARKAVAVAAYDSNTFTYADFSGRGFTRHNSPKPDISAPGVNITAPAPSNGYLSVTGTSFAAPFVSAGAALLMQWGIVWGNDPYLYGEKIRAFLQRGARPISALSKYPDERSGYGTLCLKDSFFT